MLLFLGGAFARYEARQERWEAERNQAPVSDYEPWQQEFLEQGCYDYNGMIVCE